jgi:hypothetical protein
MTLLLGTQVAADGGTGLVVYKNALSGNNQNPSREWEGNPPDKESRTIGVGSMPSGWNDAVSAVEARGIGCQIGLFADNNSRGSQWWEFLPYQHVDSNSSSTIGYIQYPDMTKMPPGNDTISSMVLLCPHYGEAGLYLSSGVNGQPTMRGQDWLPGYAQSTWDYTGGTIEVTDLGKSSSIGDNAVVALYAWGKDCRVRLYQDIHFAGDFTDIWTDSKTEQIIVPDLALWPGVGRNQASSFRMKCGITREW